MHTQGDSKEKRKNLSNSEAITNQFDNDALTASSAAVPTLPPEIIQQIFIDVEVKTLSALDQASKYGYDLATYIWQRRTESFLKNVPHSAKSNSIDIDYRAVYRNKILVLDVKKLFALDKQQRMKKAKLDIEEKLKHYSQALAALETQTAAMKTQYVKEHFNVDEFKKSVLDKLRNYVLKDRSENGKMKGFYAIKKHIPFLSSHESELQNFNKYPDLSFFGKGDTEYERAKTYFTLYNEIETVKTIDDVEKLISYFTKTCNSIEQGKLKTRIQETIDFLSSYFQPFKCFNPNIQCPEQPIYESELASLENKIDNEVALKQQKIDVMILQSYKEVLKNFATQLNKQYVGFTNVYDRYMGLVHEIFNLEVANQQLLSKADDARNYNQRVEYEYEKEMAVYQREVEGWEEYGFNGYPSIKPKKLQSIPQSELDKICAECDFEIKVNAQKIESCMRALEPYADTEIEEIIKKYNSHLRLIGADLDQNNRIPKPMPSEPMLAFIYKDSAQYQLLLKNICEEVGNAAYQEYLLTAHLPLASQQQEQNNYTRAMR